MAIKKEKKKVLLVSDYYFPHWTGIAKATQIFASVLQDTYDVAVLTVRFKKNLKRIEVKEKTKIYRSEYLFTISRSRYSLKMLSDFLRIAKDYDVIFINSPFSNILPLTLLAKLMRKKILIFHHGDLILPPGVLNRSIEKIFDISSLISLSLANRIATHTIDYAKTSRTLKKFTNKITPLLLPIYFSRRKKVLNLKKKIVIGFAGRFVEEKGFDILLRAMPELIKRFPELIFYFAGQKDIPYENFFEKNIYHYKSVKKNIIFLGLLSGEKLKKFYTKLDLFVAPSRSDCFNLAQAESAVSGVPVIVSDIPGLRFIVKKTGFGYTVKKEDVNDLIEKITKGIKTRKQLLKKYDKVISLFDNEKNAQKIKEFIES